MLDQRSGANIPELADQGEPIQAEQNPAPARTMEAAQKFDATAREPRHALSQSARLRIANCLVHLETVDISEAGAKLDLAGEGDHAVILDRFAPGTIVLLTVSNMTEPQLCEVRWRSGSKIGVRFQLPLPDDKLHTLLAGSALHPRSPR